MEPALDTLPDDVDELHSIIERQTHRHAQTVKRYESEIELLREQLRGRNR